MEIQKIDIELLKTLPLPDWADDANKGTKGKLLIIGGSRRIPGAAILAARAALRAGCGSVRVAAPESIALHIGLSVPELMVIPLPETAAGTIAFSALDLIAEQCKVCDAVVLGPGLDADDETDKFAREVVQMAPLPLVVDASAISALDASFEAKESARVFTPHEKEFEALSGKTIVDEERGQIALEWAMRAGATLALKGRETFIASPQGMVFCNEAGSRALGTAGSGDVLAGVIGSLLAQGLEPAHAAVWGVHLHALAGEAVAKDMGEDGVMARDFLERLPAVQKYLRRFTSEKKTSGFGLRGGN